RAAALEVPYLPARQRAYRGSRRIHSKSHSVRQLWPIRGEPARRWGRPAVSHSNHHLYEPEPTMIAFRSSMLCVPALAVAALAASVTFIHMGFARTGSTPARQVRLFTDKAADPAGTNIGFRAIHAGAGMANLDVNLIRHRADTLTLPATPLIANLTYGAAST